MNLYIKADYVDLSKVAELDKIVSVESSVLDEENYKQRKTSFSEVVYEVIRSSTAIDEFDNLRDYFINRMDTLLQQFPSVVDCIVCFKTLRTIYSNTQEIDIKKRVSLRMFKVKQFDQ